MFARCLSVSLLALTLAAFAVVPASADGPADNLPDNVRPVPPKGAKLPDAVRAELTRGLGDLQAIIKAIGQHELLPDVLIYEKAVRWALDYNEVYDGKGTKNPGGNVKKVLAAGLERAKQLKTGQTPWTTQTGPVVRGYRSKIDGSVQPYWLIIPKDYNFAGNGKHRLDFWWHGRGETLSEANFMANSPGYGGIIPAPGALVLHPYGRYCNANKFAGEVDTFECLDHAKKHYRIDESRLVARGFSMGGAACWQFGAHFPTLWAACAPGAGFSETPEFLRVFQKETVKPTWYEQKLWHLYNASDYAQNFFNLPTVAYSGEVDSQKQAADVMAREMKKVGLELTHIIGPKTAHAYEKNAKLEVNKLIDEIVKNEKPEVPEAITFTTYTLRYNKCAWIEVTGLEKHWQPATVMATTTGDKYNVTTRGVTAFNLTIYVPKVAITLDRNTQIRINIDPTALPYAVRFVKTAGQWETITDARQQPAFGKIHGLQGPIDDAFMDSFIMVSPTGKRFTEGNWEQAEMKHAIEHWRKQFRGDARVKQDTAITDEDIKNNNLILWGDPSSNRLLAKIKDKLPVKWTEKGLVLGDKTYNAATHLPVLIYPNPLNPRKYVVLNSGFTFREYDQLNNARQVPKLPDYAIIDITTPPNSRYPGKVVQAGFFGEKWELLPNDGK